MLSYTGTPVSANVLSEGDYFLSQVSTNQARLRYLSLTSTPERASYSYSPRSFGSRFGQIHFSRLSAKVSWIQTCLRILPLATCKFSLARPKEEGRNIKSYGRQQCDVGRWTVGDLRRRLTSPQPEKRPPEHFSCLDIFSCFLWNHRLCTSNPAVILTPL